jgi:hypothetical protein
MLRVPEGADTIRCPQCKTVLALQTATTPAPVPPPSPPPSAKPAIPLPFARPPVSPPPPVAKPPEPPPPRGKTVRGKVVEEFEEVADDSDDGREKPRRPKRTDDEKLEALLERVGEQARPARIGISLMAYGAVSACAAPLGVALFFISTLFLQSGDNPFVWLPVLGVGLHWLLTTAGFGFCCAGPKEMRHMAVGGLVVMLLHAVGMLGLLQLTAQAISLASAGFGGINLESGLLSALLLANLFNNLSGVANLPLIVLFGQHVFGPHVFVVLLVAGGFEFAKLSLVGILANHYAMEGKAPELGHQSIRFVYRLFWVVIVGFVGQLIIIGVSRLGFGFVFLSLPAMMLLNAYFFWCAFAWVAEFQVLLQVVEVITPERFIDKRANLDYY